MWLTGCASPPPAAPEVKLVELPPFENPAIAELYPPLSDWADGLGWRAVPLKRRGSRLARAWVRGDPGKQPMPAPDSARVELSVFASSKAERSYGVQWSGAVRTAEGDGVRLQWVAEAGSITADHLIVELQQGDAPPVKLGAPLTWKLGERVVQTSRPDGLDAVIARFDAYRGDGLATAASTDLDALAAAVQPILDSGDFTVCDYGPSPGKGIPGPCNPRSPTPAEVAEAQMGFDGEMKRRRDALEQAESWAALIAGVTPPGR